MDLAQGKAGFVTSFSVIPLQDERRRPTMNNNVLVTGGAGFVGSNLVNSLLSDGLRVTILDTFTRQGAYNNIAWLRENPNAYRLSIIKEDVRNFAAVRDAVADADLIYHLAGQVAVTTSVAHPRADFETNAIGTLNVLEAARLSGRRLPVIFTSTNKVYGGLEELDVVEERDRYRFRSLPEGVAESQPLDFHSPYGCSKGAADQYTRDYARIYALPTVVFRMSCIYGPRQFGTEDQGWLAHFIIAALTGRPITVYGNGKQVRDVLFVDDLVRAFRLAAEKIDHVAGEIFNIGGGPTNALSVWAQFSRYLQELKGEPVSARFEDWRPGDQPCYVSDIGKIRQRLGWQPLIDKKTGIGLLGDWVGSNLELFAIRDEESQDRSLVQAHLRSAAD
jgi:CDP-paratose 2-epimerase